MKIYLSRSIFWLIFLIGIFSVSTADCFQNVLDTPAVKTPIAEKYLYNGIVSTNHRLISVGQYGIILYSDDYGKSWMQADVPVSCDLTSVYFPTPQKGWAVGHHGVVLHSSDAGATWVKQFDGNIAAKLIKDYYTQTFCEQLQWENGKTNRFLNNIKILAGDEAANPFLDVYFENESSGFVVGAFNLVFHTSDGGKTWEPWLHLTENSKFLHMYSIKSIGGDIFIAGERGMVLKYDRSLSVFLDTNTSYSGTFFGITGNSEILFAFGLRGNVFQSLDKGESWNNIPSGVDAGITAGTVSKDGRIIMVSQGGDVLLSEKNHLDFEVLNIGFPAAAVVAVEKDKIITAGFGGMQINSLGRP